MHALSILERLIGWFLCAAISERGHWELHVARGTETFLHSLGMGNFKQGAQIQLVMMRSEQICQKVQQKMVMIINICEILSECSNPIINTKQSMLSAQSMKT